MSHMSHPTRSTEPDRRSTEPGGAKTPGVRASDAEREEFAEVLRKHAGEGRLDVDELDQRLEAVYAARTRDELEPLIADLPEVVPPTRSPRPDRGRPDRSRDVRRQLFAYVAVNVLLVVVWAATGAGYFWPIWPMLGWGLGLISHGGRRPFGLCHGARRPVQLTR
jgi:hypothetical protein